MWTGLDLRYAETCGVRVLAVSEALTWPETRKVFAPWIDKLWQLRYSAEGGKSGAFGTFLKFYMNSLSGKLGMRPDSLGYVINPSEVKRAYVPLGDGIYLYEKPAVREVDGKVVAGMPCCHVEWAAYVTSWARIEWHRQATAGADDLVYGDTDSVFTLGERHHNVGDRIGQWQAKGKWTWFSAIAPTFYCDLPEAADGQTDGFKVRSKGVRAKGPDDWRALFQRDFHAFQWNASEGFRSAARRGTLFRETTMRRRIRRGTGDRILMADGTTRPPMAKELEFAR
jgi:hypothetical protein